MGLHAAKPVAGDGFTPAMESEVLERPTLAEWTAGDGASMHVLPVAAQDLDLMRHFIKAMSAGSRYFRFGRMEVDFADEGMRCLCRQGAAGGIHLMVLKRDAYAAAVVGSGSVVLSNRGDTGELAIAVADRWQRIGVGRRLLMALAGSAKQQGCREMHARVLATNRGTLAFLQRQGFTLLDAPAEPWVKFVRRVL
jgi:acetyltransferase